MDNDGGDKTFGIVIGYNSLSKGAACKDAVPLYSLYKLIPHAT